jgi:cytochrome d ubiquinol oxidase subunit I
VRLGPSHFDAVRPPEGGPGQDRTPSRPMSAADETTTAEG